MSSRLAYNNDAGAYTAPGNAGLEPSSNISINSPRLDQDTTV